MTGRTTFTRPQAEPTPDVVYGRRVLAEAAALIRDGQLGGQPDGLTAHDATRARAEIAGWLDFFATHLKNVHPTDSSHGRAAPPVRRRRAAHIIAVAENP